MISYRLIFLMILFSLIFTKDDKDQLNILSESMQNNIGKKIYLEIAGLDKGWGRVGGSFNFNEYYFEPYLLGGYSGEIGILFKYKLNNTAFGIGLTNVSRTGQYIIEDSTASKFGSLNRIGMPFRIEYEKYDLYSFFLESDFLNEIFYRELSSLNSDILDKRIKLKISILNRFNIDLGSYQRSIRAFDLNKFVVFNDGSTDFGLIDELEYNDEEKSILATSSILQSDTFDYIVLSYNFNFYGISVAPGLMFYKEKKIFFNEYRYTDIAPYIPLDNFGKDINSNTSLYLSLNYHFK